RAGSLKAGHQRGALRLVERQRPHERSERLVLTIPPPALQCGPAHLQGALLVLIGGGERSDGLPAPIVDARSGELETQLPGQVLDRPIALFDPFRAQLGGLTVVQVSGQHTAADPVPGLQDHRRNPPPVQPEGRAESGEASSDHGYAGGGRVGRDWVAHRWGVCYKAKRRFNIRAPGRERPSSGRGRIRLAIHPRERRSPSSGFSRRDFLKRSGGAALAAPSLAAILASCTKPGTLPPSSNASGPGQGAYWPKGSPYPLARQNAPVTWELWKDPIASG